MIKILFVRPDGGDSKQLYAIDHYAIQIASVPGAKSALLGSMVSHPQFDSVEYLGTYPAITKKRLLRSIFARLTSLVSAYQVFKPDIVHVRAHMGDVLCLLLARILIPNAKVVLDIRTLSTSTIKHGLYGKLGMFFSRSFDHIFALNQDILDAYVPNAQRVSILPLGFDAGIFFPEEAGCHLMGKEIGCIYYGSLGYQRRLDRLIDAVVASIKAGVPLRLDIFGAGVGKDELEGRVPIELRDKIRFRGFLPYAEMGAVIRRYDLGISYIPITPIFDANLPLKTIEMMACGLPILATSTRGNREVVLHGTNGWLVDDSREALELAFQKINSAIIAELRGGALQIDVSRYSWQRLSREILMPIYIRLKTNEDAVSKQ